MLSAAGWPERFCWRFMVVQHGTRELLASLMGYAASAAVLGTFLMHKMVSASDARHSQQRPCL